MDNWHPMGSGFRYGDSSPEPTESNLYEEMEKIRAEFQQNGRDADLQMDGAPCEEFAKNPQISMEDIYPMFYRKTQRKCGFCKKNGETWDMFTSHFLKDKKGLVSCPVLRRYKCRFCQATGDFAHTDKYCPLYNERLARMERNIRRQWNSNIDRMATFLFGN